MPQYYNQQQFNPMQPMNQFTDPLSPVCHVLPTRSPQSIPAQAFKMAGGQEKTPGKEKKQPAAKENFRTYVQGPGLQSAAITMSSLACLLCLRYLRLSKHLHQQHLHQQQFNPMKHLPAHHAPLIDRSSLLPISCEEAFDEAIKQMPEAIVLLPSTSFACSRVSREKTPCEAIEQVGDCTAVIN